VADITADEGTQLPAGQVWQCLVNGQKVFSDKRCGHDASVRQLSDVNMMQAAPASPSSLYGGYSPAYGAPPLPQAAWQPDQNEPDGQGDAADQVYSGPLYLSARERPHREHRRHHESPPRQPVASHGQRPSHNLR
jgi:hypothetical protein